MPSPGNQQPAYEDATKRPAVAGRDAIKALLNTTPTGRRAMLRQSKNAPVYPSDKRSGDETDPRPSNFFTKNGSQIEDVARTALKSIT